MTMRKIIRLGALAFAGLLFHTNAMAQEKLLPCGTDQQIRKLYAENPQLAEEDRQFLLKNSRIEEAGNRKRFIYTIPIVFHILHEYGTENISDAQVYDALAVMNADFRKLNADISEVVPEFAGIAADCQIEFRLATIDPFGNCTNGIEHIYSHETNVGDDWSKLNQWHRSDYLNIWVTAVTLPQTAAYTYKPIYVQGTSFFKDGIIALHYYTGSIGTSNVLRSHTLTHEVGHWLGLAHVWGDGPVGTACGDDGIEDTPITKGHTVCDLNETPVCTPGVVENIQNYMDYSYCNRMFTNDQAAFMRNVIQDETAQRNNLWAAENHVATGINVITDPTCVPVADFSVSSKNICAGDAVTYNDASWKAGVTTRLWTFPGGSPAVSTEANPVVTYAQDGFYTATLEVSNAEGSDTKTVTNMVYVSGDWAAFHGPESESFETGTAGWWIVQNPEENFGKFELQSGVGTDFSRCFALKNFRDISQAPQFQTDWFYNNRLGETKDYLISPSFDLSNTSNITVSFDYAYGTKAQSAIDVDEVLRVYSSKDCGKTWTLRKTLTGANLLTAGYVGNTDFVPSSNQWATETFNYAADAADSKTRFRFEFKASDLSNNLYIDNFNVQGTLAITEGGNSPAGLQLSPNPVAAGSVLSISAGAQEQAVSLQLTDVNGAIISTFLIEAGNGAQTIGLPMNVAKGCYFLQAIRGNSRSVYRVIVF